ncbi:MAG: TetR family transcriptional regulator C-terminal domain-containing protein [Candidatus Pristimantibacillus lignocellulolyticus]|uniref:TetR family transcriptional regulator C-terminal domain-containing protein n=1 Tax=Candidatus Pristimantibacillus lignocellulolyticus TaxID=2994561 RepID=A0A9J6ZID5_9BACL|nr:MAG: TetR family transcriptional regulator C-terminal domain-containing protein [Candidatus Pristimantibacillus lignocellulolyticus]
MSDKLDPRQIRSKKKLHEAYLALITATKSTLSIKEICDEAGVTRPTFYKLYNDVYSLRTAMYKEMLHELNQMLVIKEQMRVEDVRVGNLPINMVNLFQHILDNAIFYHSFLLISPDSDFINELKSILKNYIEDGLRIADSEENKLSIPLEFAINYAVGAYFESILWWIQNNFKFSADEMTILLLRISLKGPFTDEIQRLFKLEK